jgi:hypothetical protein
VARRRAAPPPPAQQRPRLAVAPRAAASNTAAPSTTTAPTPRVIAVAVDQSRASRHAVRWACEHLWRGDPHTELRLLHVVPSVSSTSAFALGGLAAGVASAPLDSAASLDGSDSGDDDIGLAADLAAAEAVAAAAAAGSRAAAVVTATSASSSGGGGHHSSAEQRALARRAERALSASLLPLCARRGLTRVSVEVVRGRAGASVAEELSRAAEASGAAMLVLASARRPNAGGGGGGGGGGGDGGGGFDDGRAQGGWLGQVLGGVPSLLFRPPVSAEVARRCKVPTVVLSGPE